MPLSRPPETALAPRRLDLWSGRLRIAALRVPGADVVAARAWLRGGARVEPSPGLALFTGRMLVEGTQRRSWREIAEQAEARGVSLDGSATAEVHGLALGALADDADLALGWLAELLLSPRFASDRFELLREQTLGELVSMAERPEVITGWAFRDQLYHPHPLAAPGQGTPESLAGLTPEDCRRFHQASLARGGVIAVAGRIDEQGTLARLDQLFRGADADSSGRGPRRGRSSDSGDPRLARTAGRTAGPAPTSTSLREDREVEAMERSDHDAEVSAHEPAARDRPRCAPSRPPAPRGRPERRIDLLTASREQAHVYAGHFTVNRAHPDLPELRALGILLGSDGLAGLIPNRVREQEGLAYATGVDVLAGAGVDPGVLSIYLATHPENVERGLELVRDSLRMVLREPPQGHVLEECRTGLLGREAFVTETAGQWAALLVDSLLYDLPSYRRSFRLERIERLTPEGVFEATRRHLDPDRLRVTVGRPG